MEQRTHWSRNRLDRIRRQIYAWGTAGVVFGVWAALGAAAEQTSLVADDAQIRLTVPAAVAAPVPLQLGSSLRAEYAAESKDGPLSLGKVALEEGIKYPQVGNGIYSGTIMGDRTISAVRAGIPLTASNSLYLKNWFTKQWAGLDFSLTHTHLIERPDEELEFGMARGVSVFNDKLFLSVGEYWFNDVGARYWYRTTNVAVDYGWRHWGVSVFAQRNQDASARQDSIGAAVSRKF